MRGKHASNQNKLTVWVFFLSYPSIGKFPLVLKIMGYFQSGPAQAVRMYSLPQCSVCKQFTERFLSSPKDGLIQDEHQAKETVGGKEILVARLLLGHRGISKW